MKLVYNAKEKITFRSARWSKDYTPDLSIALRYSLNEYTMVTRHILENFPHSQHRPVVLDCGLQIPLIRYLPKPCWNFRKADWGSYEKELDYIISWIPPRASSYKRFVGAIKSVAKNTFPEALGNNTYQDGIIHAHSYLKISSKIMTMK